MRQRSLQFLATLAALLGLMAAPPARAVVPMLTPQPASARGPMPHTLEDPAVQAKWSAAQHRLYDRVWAEEQSAHDWRLLARGTNVELRYDANSLHRDGDDVYVLQSSQVLNPRGSDFLARTFQYHGPNRVHALINDLEFDCVAPREQMFAQWLDDPVGDIVQLRHGPGRWQPLSATFRGMRSRFCLAEGLPATTLASELAAWHQISPSR